MSVVGFKRLDTNLDGYFPVPILFSPGKVVATITGHKDTKMLMRYAHLRVEGNNQQLSSLIINTFQNQDNASDRRFCTEKRLSG